MSFSFPRLPQRRGGMGEDPCNTRLSLGQGGLAEGVAAMNWGRGRGLQEQPARFHVLFPPCPKEEEYHEEGSKLRGEGLDAMGCRLRLGTADHEEDVVSGGGGSQADSNGGGRKKLRLSREQLDFLERSFRQQNTLTATQKQELAERLNLLPRQVEVWFQNKRARTKLKQTEVDCEFLKKCCESLSDENQRLKEELWELRSSKQAPPFHMQPTNTAKITMCPSCEWVAATDGGTRGYGGDVAARAIARSRGLPSNSSSMSFLGSLRK